MIVGNERLALILGGSLLINELILEKLDYESIRPYSGLRDKLWRSLKFELRWRKEQALDHWSEIWKERPLLRFEREPNLGIFEIAWRRYKFKRMTIGALNWTIVDALYAIDKTTFPELCRRSDRIYFIPELGYGLVENEDYLTDFTGEWLKAELIRVESPRLPKDAAGEIHPELGLGPSKIVQEPGFYSLVTGEVARFILDDLHSYPEDRAAKSEDWTIGLPINDEEHDQWSRVQFQGLGAELFQRIWESRIPSPAGARKLNPDARGRQ